MKFERQTLVRIVAVMGLLLIGMVCYQLNPEFYQTILGLLVGGDIEGTIAFIQSYGPYAVLVSFFLVVFINMVAVLPNIFILAANGIIFGVTVGTLVSWLAESVGVVISFVLMRTLLRDYAHNLIVKNAGLKKVDEFSGKRGFRIMLVARSIPYIPSGLITALGAVSSISLADYALATFIGKLPSAWIEVTLGHDLLSYREHSLRLTLLVVISALAYYAFWRYKKKAGS